MTDWRKCRRLHWTHPSFAAANLPAQAPVQGFYDHEHYTTLDLSKPLAEVNAKLPVYGLYGQEDGLFDPVHLQAISQIIGADHLFTVPGASHNIYVDQQPAFLAQVVKWLCG